MVLTKKHRAYFKAAKAVSELSDFNKVHIGAVAVCNHRIISSACNSLKTNPLQKRYNKYRFTADEGKHTLHAEVACLLPLISQDIDFNRVSLYIYRQHKNGNPALAKPCPSCMALIRDLGIKNIYYTGNNSFVQEDLVY